MVSTGESDLPSSCEMKVEPEKHLTWLKSQDGGGIGRGDHFFSYKFIERTIEL